MMIPVYEIIYGKNIHFFQNINFPSILDRKLSGT